MAEKWIQRADEEMERKGTKGKFGKATRSKIAKGKKAGGKRKKEAIFAENMLRIAAKHKRKKGKKSGRSY